MKVQAHLCEPVSKAQPFFCMSSNTDNFRNLAFCLIVPPTFCTIAQQTEPVSRAWGKLGTLDYLSLETCFWWLPISPEEVPPVPSADVGILGSKGHSHHTSEEQKSEKLV